jgi:hypothetical protein
MDQKVPIWFTDATSGEARDRVRQALDESDPAVGRTRVDWAAA